ncbi:hypothetical protein MTR_5g007800 [Medicago truncatula]|uniref:Uncharacterized protein n=1 Tax=Medicago truncatula TaxID=3880 RepID=G7K6H9_MEDTR|nr:hypothetical protein MTR_5g007800 [Medicago truncatula]
MVESRKLYQHACDVDSLEQHADINLWRQITRNKPLKVRAFAIRNKPLKVRAQDPFNPCRKPRMRGKTMMLRLC